MENFLSISSISLGLLLRIALPLAVTFLAVFALRWLDRYWQTHAGANPRLVAARPKNVGCWDIKHCSAEDRAKCNAYAHPETPCWQVKRNKQGQLNEACLGCNVFESAVPVKVQS
jgi:hypothetical protein